MKTACERCGTHFQESEMRYACTHDCTFCERCSTELHGVCPNCGGSLGRTTG